MVVGQQLITPTVEICIQQLGRLEEMHGLITIRCDAEYLACAEPLRRAGLSAAAETLATTVLRVKMWHNSSISCAFRRNQ